MNEERLPPSYPIGTSMPEKRRTSCPFCDQTFTDASNRRRHVKRKHHDRVDTPEPTDAPTLGSQGEFDALVAVGIRMAFRVPELTTADEIGERDVLLWLGVAREIVKVRTLTQGMVRVWFGDAWWIDIPARMRVQRMDQ